MKRRDFFGVMGAATAVAAVPVSVRAAECSEELPVEVEIGTNHGHSLDLDIKQVVQLLRDTNDSCPVELDIQGNSNHPHIVALSHQDLLKLIVKGEIEEVATGGSHTHEVLITLGLS